MLQPREGEKAMMNMPVSPRARLGTIVVASFRLQVGILGLAHSLPQRECHEISLALIRTLHVAHASFPLLKHVISQEVNNCSKLPPTTFRFTASFALTTQSTINRRSRTTVYKLVRYGSQDLERNLLLYVLFCILFIFNSCTTVDGKGLLEFVMPLLITNMRKDTKGRENPFEVDPQRCSPKTNVKTNLKLLKKTTTSLLDAIITATSIIPRY